MEDNKKLLWTFPKELRDLLAHYRLQENHIGCSDSRVFRLESLDGKPGSYLKVAQTGPAESLAYEADILRWLEDKAPVPEVYYYAKANGMEYLLMSEINGLDASTKSLHVDPEGVVKIFAEGLRLLHSLDISDCQYRQTLDIKLQKAHLNVINNLVDELDFQPGDLGRTAQDVYEEIIATRPKYEDLVLTHGDYCLPNVIIDNGRLSGFIDMGRGGIADRYQDIALAVRTIRSNLGSERWVELFLKEYGLNEIDSEKIKFYIMLDELF